MRACPAPRAPSRWRSLWLTQGPPMTTWRALYIHPGARVDQWSLLNSRPKLGTAMWEWAGAGGRARDAPDFRWPVRPSPEGPRYMKAAVVTSFGSPPSFEHFREPEAGDGETVITVHAAALSPIVKLLASGRHYTSGASAGFVPGVDGVGVDRDGRRVYFLFPKAPFGSMAERSLVASQMIIRLRRGRRSGAVGPTVRCSSQSNLNARSRRVPRRARRGTARGRLPPRPYRRREIPKRAAR
jgi:hypothetical protein